MQAINIAAADALAVNDDEDFEAPEPFVVDFSLYPNTLTLEPTGSRQIKVLNELGGADASHLALPTGTVYVSSDDSIASVSASGLITAHRAGQVTLSLIHLGSALGFDGVIVNQALGQQDIVLDVQAAQATDESAATPTPRAIEVAAGQAAVIASATGERVMIGAGSLREAAAVSISRINVAELEAVTGIPLPAPQTLQAIAAFRLDLDGQRIEDGVQLAIATQIDGAPGDAVWFFKKVSVPQPDGSQKTMWWLTDTGSIGADGVARSASPPFRIDASGEYLVVRRIPGVIGDPLTLLAPASTGLMFDTLGFGLGLFSVESLLTFPLQSINEASGSAFVYHFGIPQFADIPTPSVGTDGAFRLDLRSTFPPPPFLPNNQGTPQIASVALDGQTLTVSLHAQPGVPSTSELLLQMLPGGGKPPITIRRFTGNPTALAIDVGSVTANGAFFGQAVALGAVSWRVVRNVPNPTAGPITTLTASNSKAYGSSPFQLVPQGDMAAVLTRTGIAFVRENGLVVGGVVIPGLPLVERTGDNDLGGTYLFGRKTEPVVYSQDRASVYVAGTGVVYQIDTITSKLINTIDLEAGKNIASLVVVGKTLFIGESGPGARLLMLDINPTSTDYNQTVSVQSGNANLDLGPDGIAGMAADATGKTLVVSAPAQIGSIAGLNSTLKRGNLLLIDLDKLSYQDIASGKRGQLSAAPVLLGEAALGGSSGKGIANVTATDKQGEFLVTFLNDYNRGLSTLKVTRPEAGALTGVLHAIDLSQPARSVRIDRLDIQRAQSAVLVTRDGVEYAIVSDDNFHFLDPYWKAMNEAPMFMAGPNGVPIPFGGSISAKKVAVGGKIGVIKDPFGRGQVHAWV